MSKASKAAFVTGGSGGMGKAVALRLAADGFAVVCHYAGNPAGADAPVTEIAGRGGEAIAVKGDVSESADVDALYHRTMDAFGRLDAVVHCAGIMPLSPIVPEGLDVFDRTIRVNLRGSYLIMAHARSHLGEGGRIVAFSSSERLGQPNDIAGTVAFLVGDDGEWVNSQIVYVNSGFA